MTLNLYVMPIIGTGTRTDPRRPKYRDSIFPPSLFLSGMFDYGDEPWCLCGVVDITAAANSSLVSNADVFALPTNLDQTIPQNQVNSDTNALESVNIPGTWITSAATYRQVVRFIGGCCQFMQRYQGQALPFVFQSGITLNTTFGALPSSAQQGLLTAAQSFGFDTTTLVPASTLRTAVKSMADQYVATQPPLTLAGVQL